MLWCIFMRLIPDFSVFQSPDLQLVEPESLLVKEERMEDPLGDAEADDVPLIGEDGECVSPSQLWLLCCRYCNYSTHAFDQHQDSILTLLNLAIPLT